ncbi:hypothetical protein AAFX91_08265 [Bradyrhizobium sp. 31Argb]|uniref:hypothetical protein n=1 Tax=Bradyrhizobium sp. 31Argb TaxID=3141247 RepID=UPI0037482BFB
MTRDEAVRALANDIKVEVRLIELRRLADETSTAFTELLAHGTPAEAALHFFACGRLLQRLNEEREEIGDALEKARPART